MASPIMRDKEVNAVRARHGLEPKRRNLMTAWMDATRTLVLSSPNFGLGASAEAGVRVVAAVAASAAVPGAFAPVPIRRIRFSCAERVSRCSPTAAPSVGE